MCVGIPSARLLQGMNLALQYELGDKCASGSQQKPVRISPLFAPPNAALEVAAPKCRGLHQVTNVADRGSAARMGKTGSWASR
jgi:hypothetical protein